MTIAIIGGTGFIGRAVAERVLHWGQTPVVIARGQHPVDLPAGAVFERADRMHGHAILDILALGMLGQVHHPPHHHGPQSGLVWFHPHRRSRPA